MTVYLHDSRGAWIAFRTDSGARDVFNPDGDWIGWLPWGDDDVVTPDGEYLGTIRGDRLFAQSSWRYRGNPGYPGAPAYPGRASYPGTAPYTGVPGGYDDVPTVLLRPRAPSQANSS